MQSTTSAAFEWSKQVMASPDSKGIGGKTGSLLNRYSGKNLQATLIFITCIVDISVSSLTGWTIQPGLDVALNL